MARRKQSKLIQIIRAELSGATFETNDIITELTPSPPEHWKSVYDSLLPEIPKICSSLMVDNERASYDLFKDLLNNVLNQAKHFFSTTSSQPLVFSVYDRQVQPSEADLKADPLKPDFVGLSRGLILGERVPWHEIEIVGEAKSDWPLMVEQAATYCRCMFHAKKARRFVLAILYNYKQRAVRFAFYHRAGVTTTEPLQLYKDDGFRNFVRVLVGISLWESPGSRGLDPTRDNSTFRLADLGTYRIVRTLCDRACVRGRATRVYLISRITDEIPIPEPAPTADEPPHHYYELRKRGPPKDHIAGSSVQTSVDIELRALPRSTPACVSTSIVGSPHGQDDPSPSPFDISASIRDGPASSHFVLKESFPLADGAIEAEMFESVMGEFGLPDVHGWYRVSDTTSLLPPDARFWSYRRGEAESGSPERRVQLRVLFEQRGRDITEARGPRELLECILHAMIGHWNLFKNGLLHRDVNIGNVLLLEAPIARKPMRDFRRIGKLTSCAGILIDGDQAIRWKDVERTMGQKRSVTLPFMSERHLEALRLAQATGENVYIDTAIDDLESFLWVLVYAALLITDASGSLSPIESLWLSYMMSESVEYQLSKRSIPEESVIYATSPVLVVLAPLFVKWKSLATAASVALVHNQHVPTLAFCRKYYEEYLRIGFKHLRSLPETWEDLQSGTPQAQTRWKSSVCCGCQIA